jgi:hypothetical protein
VIFRRKPKRAVRALTLDRQNLIRAAEALAAGQRQADELRAKLDNLKGIIATAPAADADLQRAIAADGGAELAAFASGAASTATAALLAKSDAAIRAAAAAQRALPAVEAQLKAAIEQLNILEREKSKAVIDLLAIGANQLAEQNYLANFRAMAAGHDELLGIAQALVSLGGWAADIIAATTALEVPKFKLPALQSGSEVYSPYLRHVPDNLIVGAAARAWRAAAERLAADPLADVSELMIVTPGAIRKRNAEAEPSPVPGRMTRHRERPPAPTVKQLIDSGASIDAILYGGAADNQLAREAAQARPASMTEAE